LHIIRLHQSLVHAEHDDHEDDHDDDDDKDDNDDNKAHEHDSHELWMQVAHHGGGDQDMDAAGGHDVHDAESRIAVAPASAFAHSFDQAFLQTLSTWIRDRKRGFDRATLLPSSSSSSDDDDHSIIGANKQQQRGRGCFGTQR
jgi:hypothetical protein